MGRWGEENGPFVARACSRARTDPERPILNATFVKGKITTSRIGTIGYHATSAGVRSEYSSMVKKLFIPVFATKASRLIAASPSKDNPIVNHFTQVRYFCIIGRFLRGFKPPPRRCRQGLLPESLAGVRPFH